MAAIYSAPSLCNTRGLAWRIHPTAIVCAVALGCLAVVVVCRLEHVYLRGNQIRLVVMPEILKNAPLFK